MNFMLNVVRALNTINSNVWAFILVLIGVFLVLHGSDKGGELIVGGFAILKAKSDTVNTEVKGDIQVNNDNKAT